MKVIRAHAAHQPLRRGTDLDPFCSQHGSTIISFAINRYMYLTWNDRPTGGCRLSYSQTEELGSLFDAKHSLVRQTAHVHGIEETCTLTIVSDLPQALDWAAPRHAVTLIKMSWPLWTDAILVSRRDVGTCTLACGLAGLLPASMAGFTSIALETSPCHWSTTTG